MKSEINAWWTSQTEQFRKQVLAGIPHCLEYGLVKSVLPPAGDDAVERAYLKATLIPAPIVCPSCEANVTRLDYTTTGRKLYNVETGHYDEDHSRGSGDISFSCPDCSHVFDFTEAELNQVIT